MTFEEFRKNFEKVPVDHYPHNAADTPLVSVIVVTYNHENYIKECLDGILKQETDFSFEVLLGDDASTDATRKICLEYAQKYPDKIRLFLHSRENNIKLYGRATGRFNLLYSMGRAKGKYLAFCDGDDYWTDPLKLKKQVNFLEENDQYILAYHAYINRAVDDNPLLKENLFGPLNQVLYKPITSSRLLRNQLKEFPESLLKAPNGDQTIMFHLKQYGKIMCLRDIKPTIKRVHPGGVMSLQSKKIRNSRGLQTWQVILDTFRDTKHEKYLKRKVNTFRLKEMFIMAENEQQTQKKLNQLLSAYIFSLRTGLIFIKIYKELRKVAFMIIKIIYKSK